MMVFKDVRAFEDDGRVAKPPALVRVEKVSTLPERSDLRRVFSGQDLLQYAPILNEAKIRLDQERWRSDPMGLMKFFSAPRSFLMAVSTRIRRF